MNKDLMVRIGVSASISITFGIIGIVQGVKTRKAMVASIENIVKNTMMDAKYKDMEKITRDAENIIQYHEALEKSKEEENNE